MIIIGGGRLLTLWNDTPYISDGAVAVDGQSVIQIGSTEVLKSAYPEAEFVYALGGIIMPGLIDAHTHICRALTRGLNKCVPSESYSLHLWYRRFECMLDLDSCVKCAYALMTEAIRNGVTTVFDMHSSTLDPRGMLFMLAGAAGDVGMRACLGCAVNGSDGTEMLKTTADENIGFIDYCAANTSPLIRPAFCLNEINTIDNDSLVRIVKTLNGRAPLHISVDDGPDDNYHAMHSFGKSAVARLSDLGLLGRNTLLAHCSCLSPKDAEIIAGSGASVTLTPLSDALKTDVSPNLNNLASKDVKLVLGTDGISTNALSLPNAIMLREKLPVDPKAATDILLRGNAEIASSIFGMDLGVLKPGAAADIIIMDYDLPTEFNADNAHLHLLYGINGGQCSFSMINGSIVMRDRKLVNVNERRLYEKLRETAKRLKDSFIE